MELSRRSFVTSAAAGVAAGIAATSAIGSISAAFADEAEDEAGNTYDVIVVGSGLSGMSAAIALQDAGKSVVILDKGSYGGNSLVCSGVILLPPTDDEEGEEAFVQDTLEKSSNQADEDLVRVLAAGAWDSVYWLQSLGLDTGTPTALEPYSVYTTHADDGMTTIMSTLKTTYEDNGGEIITAKMLDLVTNEDGRVTGVKARQDGTLAYYTANDVVLATGGYSGNKGFLEEYIGPEADQMMVRGFERMTGDGMIAAAKLGAGYVQVGGYEGLHIAAVSPQNVAGGNPTEALPYSIAINSEGKRFVDESLGYVVHGKAVAEQPGSVDGLVVDATIAAEHEKVAETIGYLPERGVDVICVDTLEELAEAMEVDFETLQATIEEFNAAVQDDNTTSGLEVEKTALAYKIETPPYYAFYPLNPGITLSIGGLYVNTEFQVLEPDGEVIPGLYAVGEVMGGWTYDDYLSGASLTACMVSGRVAAATIVAE